MIAAITLIKESRSCCILGLKGNYVSPSAINWHCFATSWLILAEGAIALLVTLSGSALFASWKLLQFLSSLIVKVILAIFMRASAQQEQPKEGEERAKMEDCGVGVGVNRKFEEVTHSQSLQPENGQRKRLSDFPWHHQKHYTRNITRTLPEHYQNITKHYQNITRTLPGHYQTITRTLPEHLQTIAMH